MTERQQPYKTSQPVVQTEKKLEQKITLELDKAFYDASQCSKCAYKSVVLSLEAEANRQLEAILADLKAENERLKTKVEVLDGAYTSSLRHEDDLQTEIASLRAQLAKMQEI